MQPISNSAGLLTSSSPCWKKYIKNAFHLPDIPTCLKKSGLLDSTPSTRHTGLLLAPQPCHAEMSGRRGGHPTAPIAKPQKAHVETATHNLGTKHGQRRQGYPPSAQALTKITPLARRRWGTTLYLKTGSAGYKNS